MHSDERATIPDPYDAALAANVRPPDWPHAGETISEITLAMAAKVGLGRLSAVIHPYPTCAGAIRQVADQYNATRLTPFRTRWLRRLLAWRR